MTDKQDNERSFIRRCVIASATVIITVVLLGFMWLAVHALLLIFSAALFAVGLDGLARLLARPTHMSRHAAVIVTALLLALALGAALTVGGMNVNRQAPQLREQIAHSIDQISTRLEHNQFVKTVLDHSVQGSGGNGGSSSLGQQFRDEMSGAASTTLGTLTDVFIIVIIGLYLALEPGLYRRGVLHLFPPHQQQYADDMAAEAAKALRRWLTGRATSMTVVGVASAIGLWAYGIPFALLLGVIAGLLTFIPYLGAIVSSVPALLVAALHGLNAVIYVAGLYLILHVIEGYVLAPLIQRKAVSIAPAFLLSAQVIGGALAGVFGVALATPIALVGAVIIQLSYVRDVLAEEPHLPGEAPND
ncbi:MAG: AI-2E family transporter [Salinisphaera sp.]|jgi:predicted PurR-regulated permease PerM|nr:AI-2E family transporter [Salinisphaera sp.]